MTPPKKLSFAVTHPDLALEVDGWDPKSVVAGSHKKMSWKCKLGHQWNATVKNRSSGLTGCPICSNRQVLIGFNDLVTTHPDLALEADGWDPKSVVAGSHKKMSWKCKLGHQWTAALVERQSGAQCPYCSNHKVLIGFNDLVTTHPDLALEADGWDPKLVISGSHKKMSWKCDLGHRWNAQVGSRASGTGCAICSGKVVLIGFNDLVTTRPDLAAQADGWDPTTVTSGSGKIVSWKCDLGHRWKAGVHKRTSGRGCPVCSGQMVLVGFNDLATVNPDLAAQADGWDSTTMTSGSRKIVSWKCDLGHRWKAGIGKRTSGRGCPVCSGQMVLVGFNDLATVNPDLAAQADGWDPTTVAQYANKIVGWKCDLGHRWSASIANRSSGRGCPTCATFGFDPNLPSFLYFIDHFDLQMLQIGITNFPDDRLGSHKRAGWEVIELRGPMDGHLTQQLETSCLHALEKRGAVLGHKAGIEKFDGYSEAWTKSSLNVTSIKQLLEWVYEDE